eukprot:CAMPEP_0168530040 /NCGR_PEP_ID=MMETSP0405-20121227/14361_1 /TAXON_ID=498012 /ORGANISM="Trichosphaerium sp, Strain Am-I-7 wt" /LENGTH=125 /DNA_ID=CAMNT_0008554067 /DNA_START=51 /DNA_END=425 /DNA_ORIENTATION=-
MDPEIDDCKPLTYDLRSIQGNWALSLQGAFFDGSNHFFYGNGIIYFDGLGGCTGKDNVLVASADAAITAEFIGYTTCSYSVNPDGTAILQFTKADGGSFSDNIIIINKNYMTSSRRMSSDPGDAW